MSARTLISSLTPPLLRQGIRAIIHRKLLAELAEKRRTYPDWETAAAAAGRYDDEMVNAFRAERAKTEPGMSLIDNPLNWLVKFLPSPLHIVDFGGATGSVGAALRAAGAQIQYTVVENPTLVRLMSGRVDMVYTDAIPAACDIFYTSGTLQCVADPYAVLEQAFTSARIAVVLKRNNFCEDEIYRVHYTPLFDNGAGPVPEGFTNVKITYPYRTVRESQALAIAARHGFELISRTPETGNGVVIEGEDVYGAQLTFLRRGLV